MNKKNKRRKRRKKRTSNGKNVYNKNKKDYIIRPDDVEIWRIYGISVHPDSLEKDKQGSPIPSSTNDPSNQTTKATDRSILQYKNTDDHIMELPSSLQRALTKKLNLESVPSGTRCVRQSLDARKKLDHPVYNYVVDIPIQASLRHSLGWKVKSGRIELLRTISCDDTNSSIIEEEEKLDSDGKIQKKYDNEEGHEYDEKESQQQKKTVVVVGMGPAGLFCALRLALKSNSKIRPILLDRGQPVDKRGQDIGALIHRRKLNEESNYAFGEGGAGTWSDGKLTTRIGRNSETVRWVLGEFVIQQRIK